MGKKRIRQITPVGPTATYTSSPNFNNMLNKSPFIPFLNLNSSQNSNMSNLSGLSSQNNSQPIGITNINAINSSLTNAFRIPALKKQDNNSNNSLIRKN